MCPRLPEKNVLWEPVVPDSNGFEEKVLNLGGKKDWEAKKNAGLAAATEVSPPNPVSQVLW